MLGLGAGRLGHTVLKLAVYAVYILCNVIHDVQCSGALCMDRFNRKYLKLTKWIYRIQVTVDQLISFQEPLRCFADVSYYTFRV